MTIRHCLRLLSCALFSVLLLLLLIRWVDLPLAKLVHKYGTPVKPFFARVMRLHDAVADIVLTYQLWIWLALLLLFVVARLARYATCSVWLVALLVLLSSPPARNLAAAYFNRPRPFQVLSGTAPDASFKQALGHFDAFPSGHATVTAALLLPWALRFPKARPWLLGWLGLVCLGRVVLEYHWLGDVVAGAVLGLSLTVVWELGTRWLQPDFPTRKSSLPACALSAAEVARS